ncbi:MAG TPA: DNA translocase FtsK [Lactobacillaceae bacterium]|jgi:S-DNA-T family DNA segregation ATPase FtsK/SpoIIIE
MPQSRSRKKTTRARAKSATTENFAVIAELAGVVLGVLALFQLGLIGVWAADLVRFFVGNFYLPVLVVLIVDLLYVAIQGKQPKIPTHFVVGAVLAFVALLTISSLWWMTHALPSGSALNAVMHGIGQDFKAQTVKSPIGGGLIGALLYTASHALLADVGTWLVSLLVLLAGIIIFFRIPARDLTQQGLEKAQTAAVNWQEQRQTAAVEKPKRRLRRLPDEVDLSAASTEEQPSAVEPEVPAVETPVVAPKINMPTPPKSEVPTPVDEESAPEEPVDVTFATTSTNDDYQLPNPDLLSAIGATDQSQEYQDARGKAETLAATLKSFNIDVAVESVTIGPTVTQYEIKPAVGVKVSRIANLADDLAMALAARSLRIEAPIPGKNLVGIEVPNDVQATVGFRDIVENAPTPKNLLTVPIGRDVSGQIKTADLSAMPHLLIAGSTGSGKSVAINGIIAGLLMQAKPDEVKLMMVDPKKVELSVYNGIPHLLTPVVSEPRKAARALQKVVKEMEERYELFAQFGIRNIAGYNQEVDKQNANAKETDAPIMQRMPYIVAIVDELADLMMTVSGEVEPAIIRIAQMGRAAGIHLILATQRPSVDVITGLIKANVPSRIAFAVSSGIDSRTILDQNGAEKLLGRGDMLFAPIGQQPQRVQGAFISDSDVENIVTFVKSQQEVEYDETLMVSDEEVAQAEGGGESSEDELFNEALDFVIQQQKASTSLLQRRFRIGYNRAARLIDDLEQGGYIGPQDGSRPREVYITDGTSGIEH